MKPLCPILKSALNSIDSVKLSSKGYLTGEICIDASVREYYASNLFGDYGNAYKRFHNRKPTLALLAPRMVSPQTFIEFDKTDIHPLNQSVNLRYGMVKDGETKGVSWDSPYTYRSDTSCGCVESIESAFVIGTESNEPCGYFSFHVSLARSPEFSCISIELPLVYVRPKFRKETTAIDLTSALSFFVTEIYKYIFKSYRGKAPLDINVNSDFESKGGERIVTFIISELECTTDILKETYPHKAHKLGSIVKEVGY